jgi:hypothetical protein
MESAPLLAAALGLWAGILHAVTGPDHLAGVAPLAVRARAQAWRAGVAWGLGHAMGAAAAACVALALREQLPGLEEAISLWSERIVGVILCLVGALGLAGALRRRLHEHEAPRGALGLGFVHGAAGLSHLWAVLPALALPGTLAPGAYLCGYGFGALVAVGVSAHAIGRAQERLGGMGIERLASFASLVVGAWWLVASA